MYPSVVSMKSARTAARPSGSSRWGKWAARGRVSKRLCGIASCARAAVLERDRLVALAPDDQGRHRAQQVEAVDRAHPLPARVDHRAQRLQESLPGLGALERAQGADDRLDVDALRPAAALEPRGEVVDRVDHPRLRRERERRGGEPGQRRRPQHRAHLGAEPAARDQRQPLDPLRELPEELHRDPAAERVPDHRRRADPERGEQVADRRSVGADRVVAARGRRVAVADQVGSDHRVPVGELERDPLPVPRRVDHPVDENHRRTAADGAVDHLVAVELGLPGVEFALAGQRSPGYENAIMAAWRSRSGGRHPTTQPSSPGSCTTSTASSRTSPPGSRC